MDEATGCSAEGCGKPIKARGLCNAHYGRARKSGELALLPERHRLTNVDLVARVGDCSACGPGVAIKLRTGHGHGVAQCRKAHRSSSTPEARRRHKLKAKYGITEDDYLRILEAQGGLCAVCEKASADRLCVDHCHDTGEVRGLLCRPCNLSLGYLRDDSYNAVSAAKYLMKVIRRRSA